MKKLIAGILLFAMIFASFAGCASNNAADETVASTTGTTPTAPAVDNTLADAVAYVKTIYKNATEITAADFERVASVPVGDVTYEIEWSVNVSEDLVKIVKGDGKVIVDVNEESTEEVAYVLTATLTGTDGTQESLSWNHVLPASLGSDMSAIVDMAYQLEDGQSLGAEATLTGVITSVDTPYSADYKNVTVTIAVTGCEDRPIMCYRLKGEGADTITIGDTITVTGTLKNYKGTIEFDAGCLLESVTKGEGIEVPTDPAEIVEAAYALEVGKSLPYTVTLTGKIYGIKQMYSPFYDNITVQMYVEGKSITCFRMKGESLDTLNINDVITVTGNIKNYNGTIEFDSGCTLVSQEHHDEYKDPETFAEVLEDAKKVPNKNYLHYSTTRVGVITSKPTYNEKYDSYTFYAEIEGHSVYCYSMEYCYEGQPEKGDTIKIVGHMTAYNGTPQFDYCSILYILAKGEPEPEVVVPETFAEMYEQAKSLGDNELLPYETTQTGVVTKINSAYSEKYGNISFTMDVGGVSVYCYRLKGTGIETMAVGDTVTVTGALTAYKGTPQFGSSSVVTSVVKAEAPATTAPTEAPEEETTAPTEAPTEPEVPATLAEQLAEAAELTSGALSYTSSITGVITEIEKYNESYKSYTLTVSDGTNSVYCYSMSEVNGAELAVGDTVTASGYLTAYNGVPQFSYKYSGTLTLVEKAETEEPAEPEVPATLAEQLTEAAELENNAYLPYTTTIEGTVSAINYAYSAEYGNITFTVSADGCSVYCYRVKGEGMDTLAVGDTVNVSGYLTAYNGKAQFDKTATVTVVAKAETEEEAEMTTAELLSAAYELEPGESLEGTYTLTGEIISVDTEYSEQYKNVTVTIVVDGIYNAPIQCFRLKGEGADVIAVGDTITVSGVIKNYNGTVEFDAGCALVSYVKA